jgi:phosphate/sulfate permease
MRPETRWIIGCLVGLLALVGALVLVFLLAFLLAPPPWVQVVIGLALVLGAALLSWVVAQSLKEG